MNIYFACLFLCLFVTEKRQNGWTDRAYIGNYGLITKLTLNRCFFAIKHSHFWPYYLEIFFNVMKLKDFLKKHFFVHRVGCRTVKRPVILNKFKMAHNIFVIYVTDLKITFIKYPWKIDWKSCVAFYYLLKTKNIFYIFLPFLKTFF